MLLIDCGREKGWLKEEKSISYFRAALKQLYTFMVVYSFTVEGSITSIPRWTNGLQCPLYPSQGEKILSPALGFMLSLFQDACLHDKNILLHLIWQSTLVIKFFPHECCRHLSLLSIPAHIPPLILLIPVVFWLTLATD